MAEDIIALSQGVRASLLSAQSVAAQQARSTARLASGLKVNTALDNPTNFFTSRALDARATELNGILDGFSNARQTIQSAVDAQEKALELIDVAKAARDEGYKALKRGEYQNLTRVATNFNTASTIQPGETKPAIINAVAAAGTDAEKIDILLGNTVVPGLDSAAGRTAKINDFHSRGSNNQTFFMSVGASDRGPAASHRSTNTGAKSFGALFAELEAAIPGLDMSIVRDNPNGIPDNDNQFKLNFQMPEKDDRAIYMTGWFNIFQNMNLDHGVYWSNDPQTEKTLLSFEALPAGWESNVITTNTPGFHTSADGYPQNTWVLDDGVNPEFRFDATRNVSTLGDFVNAVNAAHDAGDFGFRMEVITDVTDSNVGKLKVFTDGAQADRLLFKPRLSEVFQELLIDGNTGGGGTPYSINNAGTPPAPGIPPATYDIDNTYWDMFQNARTEIDDIIADGSFNGTALGRGESLSLALNEKGLKLDIKQRRTNADEIGLGKFQDFEFQMFDRLDVIEQDLETSRGIVESRLSELQAKLAILETREKFTKDMMNVLRQGSASLTLADADEEGANVLATQTRQQLTNVALRLGTQADQGVLRLF